EVESGAAAPHSKTLPRGTTSKFIVACAKIDGQYPEMDRGLIKFERKALLLMATVICLFFLNSMEAQTKPDLSQYPASNLNTKQLKAAFYLPDSEKGYYRGTRFDWSGLLSRVDYAGHSFFCEFRELQHDPLNHDDICGTAEEFGMTTLPLGFAE